MIKAGRAGMVLAAGGGGALCIIASATSCGLSRQAAISTPPVSRLATPTAFPAMDYYETNCSRCHGPEGSFYGPTLGKNLTDTQLIKVVNDMADGPGGAPLKPDALAVETAFHRAMVLHTPFVSITHIGGQKWSGEVMSDATVTLIAGDTKVQAAVDGSIWTAQLPEGVKPEEVQIIAALDGKTTVLRASEAAYSHQTKLSPPDKR